MKTKTDRTYTKTDETFQHRTIQGTTGFRDALESLLSEGFEIKSTAVAERRFKIEAIRQIWCGDYMVDNAPETDGINAAMQRKKRNTNPFPEDTPQHDAWNRGFDDESNLRIQPKEV